MTAFRIGVLCNNRMALQAIGQLLFTKMLYTVVVPFNNTDLLQECRQLLAGSGVGVTAVEQSQLTDTFRGWASAGSVQAVFLMTFPWRIPGKALEVFPERVFNFHYGLLPEMRGADPVFESIRQQKQETGITVHVATARLDKGPVVHQRRLALDKDMTHGMLCTKLGALGAQMCAENWLRLLASGQSPPAAAQQEDNAAYYGRPQLKDVVINWNSMDSKMVHALVRACNPWNKGAYAAVKGWNMRICGFSFTGKDSTAGTLPGTITKADASEGIEIACNDGKTLRVDTFYTDEGIFDGKKLAQLGLCAGDRFTNIL